MIEVRVYGTPAPQGSKRHVGGGRMIESNRERLVPWRQAIVAAWVAAGRARVVNAPVALAVTFYLPRPKSHYRTGKYAAELRLDAPARPHGKPDLDKLTRGVFDALTDAGAWVDDAQAVDLHASKRYADGDTRPGAVIKLRRLPAVAP